MTDDARNVGSIKVGIYADVAGLEASLKAAQSKVAATEFKPQNMVVRIDTLQPTRQAFSRLRKSIVDGISGREGGKPVLIPLQVSQNSLTQMIATVQGQFNKAKIAVNLDWAWNTPPPSRLDLMVYWEWGNGPPPSGGTPGGGGGGPAGHTPSGTSKGPAAPLPPGGATAAAAGAAAGTRGQRRTTARASSAAPVVTPHMPTAGPDYVPPIHYAGPGKSATGGVVGRTGEGNELGLRPAAGSKDAKALADQMKSALLLAMQGDPAKLLGLASRFGMTARLQGGDFGLTADKDSLIHQYTVGGQPALGLMQQALAHVRGRKRVDQVLDDVPAGVIPIKDIGRYRSAGGIKVKTTMAPLLSRLTASHDALADFMGPIVAGEKPLSPETVDKLNELGQEMQRAQNEFLQADPTMMRALNIRKGAAGRATDPLSMLFAKTAGYGNAARSLKEQHDMLKSVRAANKLNEKRIESIASLSLEGQTESFSSHTNLSARPTIARDRVADLGPGLPTDTGEVAALWEKAKERSKSEGLAAYQARQQKLAAMSPEEQTAYFAKKMKPIFSVPIVNPLGRTGAKATIQDILDKRAEGGPVQGGLAARLAAARAGKKYVVAEGGRDELFVGKSGHMEILKQPGHIQSFPEEGQVVPRVPEWIRRGMAKDITGLAEGTGGKPRYPAGFPGGLGGKFMSADPTKSATTAARVVVTNPGFEKVFRSERQVLATLRAAQGGPIADHVAAQFAAGRGGYTPHGPSGGFNVTDLATHMEDADAAIEKFVRTLSPTQRAAAKIGARENPEVLGLQLGAVGVRGLSSQQLSFMAQRSAPLALGQITSTFAGRGAAVQRSKLASFYAGQATSFATDARAEHEKALQDLEYIANAKQMEKAGVDQTEVIKKLTDSYNEHLKSAGMLTHAGEQDRVTAENLAKSVSKVSSVVKNLGAQLSGAIGGTLLYGGAFTLINAGIESLVKVAVPAADIMSGFYITSLKVSEGLKQATVQANGNAKAIATQTVAQSGLSGAIATGTTASLAQRAAGEAGNAQLATQLDLIRTAVQVRAQNKGGGFEYAGFDRSVLQGTGGFGPTLPSGGTIGGNMSTLETVANAFRNAGGQGLDQTQRSGVSAIPIVGPLLADFIKPEMNADLMKSQIAAFNSDMTKGGAGSQFKQGASSAEIQGTLAGLHDLAAAFPASANEIGSFAESLVRSGTAIVGADGKIVTSAGDVAAALAAIPKGALTPSAGGLLNANDLSRSIQAQAMVAVSQHTRDTTVPAAAAIDYLGNRPLPVGTGVIPSGATTNLGPHATSVDPAAIQSFRDFQAVGDAALDDIRRKANQGEAALMALGVPPELINQLRGLGSQVASIQLKQAGKEAALAAMEYNHQLFIARRSLADATALTGKRGVGELGIVGVLERETFELQKQSQALSLMLQQRQINFRLALAGFTAPGETSEERAARQKEAIIEATYAQKQLNIAKKQFAVGIHLFDANAMRQLQDVQFALRDLAAQHEVQISGKLAEQTIGLIQKRIARTVKDMGVVMDLGEQIFAAKVQEATTIAINSVSKDFGAILKMTGEAWNSFGIQASLAGQSIINQLSGGGPARPPDKDWTKYPHDGYSYARGALGVAHGATSMIVGEAGNETVAILRNARSAHAGTGGGITVVVTGNTIRSEDDINVLVREITAAVERSINRKASMLGFRTV